MKYKRELYLVFFALALGTTFVSILTKQVSIYYSLIPVVFLSFYLQNFWFTMVLTLAWVWAFGSVDVLFILIPFFGTKHCDVKGFVTASVSAFLYIIFQYIYKQLPIGEMVSIFTIFGFLFLLLLQAKRWINERFTLKQIVAQKEAYIAKLEYENNQLKNITAHYLTNEANETNKVTAQITKIELKLAHYRLLSYRYTQASGDKDCPKHGNFAPYYDAKYVSRVRRVVLAYNNITEYQLATALAHKAVTIIDFYDEDRLPENLRNPK